MIIQPRVCEDDLVILGIDPGETHVGVAWACRYLEYRDGRWLEVAPGWRVVETEEMTPDDFADWFQQNLYTGKFDIVTCERFQLYPDKAMEQTGQQMLTAELIGYVRHSVRQFNKGMAQMPQVLYESNQAAIQTPTAAVLKRLGIKPVSKAHPGHDRSAELHLWHTLLRNGLVPGVRV